MVVAIVSFFTSLVFLGAFLGFRVWEEKKGVRLLEEKRYLLDSQVSVLYRAMVMGSIPVEWRMYAIHFFHWISHRLVVTAVETLRAIERPLTRLSYRLRTRVPKSNGKEVSSFLKTITPERSEGKGTGNSNSE
jgi:hypothetical protein